MKTNNNSQLSTLNSQLKKREWKHPPSFSTFIIYPFFWADVFTLASGLELRTAFFVVPLFTRSAGMREGWGVGPVTGILGGSTFTII